nr:DUF11 domain-containing protein [Chitinophagales bacterium]
MAHNSLFSAGVININVNTVPTSAINVCQGEASTFYVHATNISGTPRLVTLTYTMPSGMIYQIGSDSGGAYTGGSANIPVFNLGNINPGATVKLRLRATAGCDMINYLLSPTSPVPFNTIKASYTGGFDQLNTNTYTVEYASLLISTPTPSIDATNPDTIYRTVRITNLKIGGLSNFFFADKNGTSIQIDKIEIMNGAIPVFDMPIAYNLDTAIVQFTGNLIQNYAQNDDGDSLLEELEYIEIRERIIVSSCGAGSSTLMSWWGCNGQYCRRTSTNALIKFGQKNPNLVIGGRQRNYSNLCPGAGNNTGIYIFNNGNTHTRNFVFGIRNHYNGSRNLTFIGSVWDTASVYYKIGVNGTLKHPRIDSVKRQVDYNAFWDAQA